MSSCALEEPIDTPQNSDGYIEFVARPVGFNNQVVDTKSTASGNIETSIYSCYFLVFDTTPTTGNGKLISCSDNLVTGTNPITTIPTQRLNISKKGVQKVKACYIINVPKNFIYNESDAPIINNISALESAVLGAEHFTYAPHSDDVPMGTPQMTINDVANVKCIPAFGMTLNDVNLGSTSTAPIQITVRRLFAKVSMNLKVALEGLNDFETAVQTLTHYEVQTLKLFNLPTKVKLVEDSNNQSAWRDAPSQYTTTPMQKSGINTKVYNNSDNGYSYSFYVPEFYLNPIDRPEQKQEYKPKNYPYSDEYKTYPVYVQLEGNFVEYSISSATINYQIFLGGNSIDNYSLARNTHYTNDLTILSTNKNSSSQDPNNLDHRVTTTTINNPVAKAGETANCYVISKPGEYHFPAYMGAYKSLEDAVPCEGGDYVKLLANVAQYESDQVDITNINMYDESYDPVTNMISFRIGAVSESISTLKNLVPNGNVVIALMDDNNTKGEDETDDDTIIWSWHLWFVSDFSGNESEWATIGTHTYLNKAIMMDRNLGAHSSAGSGNYYVYGHKEPYFNGGYQGDGYNGEYGWVASDKDGNSTKSVYDPCPPKYKVPSGNVWKDGSNNMNANPNVAGFEFGVFQFYTYTDWNILSQKNESVYVYYPFSGYMTATGVGHYEDTDSSHKGGTIAGPIQGEGISGIVWYKDITYTVKDKLIYNSGCLVGLDKSILYGHLDVADRITITGYKTSVSQYTPDRWWTSYSEGKVGFAPNIVKRLIDSKIATSFDIITLDHTAPLTDSNGYQVRCVSESSPVK